VSDHDGNRNEMALTEFTEADEELAGFADEVRALYAKRAGEPIEHAQLDAIVGAAEQTVAQSPGRTSLAGQQEALTKRRVALPRKRLVLLTAAAALGVALLAAGLAAAGVSLPGIARAPLEHLGIQPPNQKSADPVDRVIDSSPPDQRNCSFGQPFAVAANVGAQGTAGGGCSRENANGDREDARSDLAGRSLGQSLWESRRSDPPPRERGFGDPPSLLAKRPDQAPQSPPATNRPDQAQQSPPATNAPDEERPPTSASQSQSGGQIAGQRSDEEQQIGQQQPHAAPTFSQGAVPSDPDSPQPSSSGHQIGQEQSQAAQAIVQGSSQGIQLGPPSTSVPQIGETHQAEGAGL
jgi:hypothetical protein